MSEVTAADVEGAEEQSTAKFKVRVRYDGEADELLIRIDRPAGTGRPRYETMRISADEAEALRIAIMNEMD